MQTVIKKILNDSCNMEEADEISLLTESFANLSMLTDDSDSDQNDNDQNDSDQFRSILVSIGILK